jgi:hypothetical protein
MISGIVGVVLLGYIVVSLLFYIRGKPSRKCVFKVVANGIFSTIFSLGILSLIGLTVLSIPPLCDWLVKQSVIINIGVMGKDLVYTLGILLGVSLCLALMHFLALDSKGKYSQRLNLFKLTDEEIKQNNEDGKYFKRELTRLLRIRRTKQEG